MTRIQHPRRSPDIAQLLNILKKHQVRYVLTGSIAAQVYGVDVGVPGDLDITPALDPDNVQRLATVLREINAMIELEGRDGHWELQPDGERTWIVDELTPDIIAARAAWVPNPADIATLDHLFLSRYGNLDVVPELVGTYDLLMERAVATWAYGHRVWVAHVDDLLATLTMPRRKKDMPCVEQLRALQRQRSLPRHAS
jgi:hypothetical protein